MPNYKCIKRLIINQVINSITTHFYISTTNLWLWESVFIISKCISFAVTNQKGGVVKTTTTENVASDLARSDNEVLIVDFDPQGDLTACLGWKNNDALENTVSTMLDDYINDKDIKHASLILKHEEDVDVIPANIELADIEMRLVSVINREQVLSSCL